MRRPAGTRANRVRQPLARKHQVHGHERPARLQHGEQGDHQLRTPLQADADPHLGAGFEIDEMAREPPRPFFQLTVGERLPPELHRHRVERPGDLRLEEMVDA
jgi:hypothetical protein